MATAPLRLRWTFVCTIVTLVCTQAAWGLLVGFNPDIHMDVPGTDANDFHIQGRLQSGDPDGNWSSPPQLVYAVNGAFERLRLSVIPDDSGPDENWYFFRADWSGKEALHFCDVTHVGLLFDVECHNVAVELIGWWTKDGRPVDVPPLPEGSPNGGAVPVIGFEVHDFPAEGAQVYRVRNDSHLLDIGVPGAGPGIHTEIVQMELLALTKEECETLLGPLPEAFIELQQKGGQEQLPWVPVVNEVGPISDNNPLDFPAESFFDVFVDIDLPDPLHPEIAQPIGPGDILVARERIRFVNNAGEPDYRWTWHIHEAHAADLGDAPDSSNSIGPSMTAYPKGGPAGIVSRYPTVYRIGSPPHGPIHHQPAALAYLGRKVTAEMEADTGPDNDGINNLDVSADVPDLDNADDGVAVPLHLPHCQRTSFNYQVTIVPTPFAPPNLYVNVWCDWNRDGDWDDTLQCPDAGILAPVPEWAIQNQTLSGLSPGQHTITTPMFLCWHPSGSADLDPIWMRITLSDSRWQPAVGTAGSGGAGPRLGYKYGETEDYYFVPGEPQPTEACCMPDGTCLDTDAASCKAAGGVPQGAGTVCLGDADGNGIDDACEEPQPNEFEFGDAPEGALAYPSTGVVGTFPTCINVPAAGWIQHSNFGAYFGTAFDMETEGNAGVCPLFNPNAYDQDECFNDGDAGLIVPAAYTIQGVLGTEQVVACTNATGALGTVCTSAQWGTPDDIDIHVVNNMPSDTTGYVNVLIDWNQDGVWGGTSSCATAAAPEHVLVDFAVPNGYSGPLSALNPPPFLIGPKPGYVWSRFTITEKRIGSGWTGEGIFEDGETEDYLLCIDDSEQPDLDFGDAPESQFGYPTMLANDGPRHVIVRGFHLGNSIDKEPDGQSDANALGDDNDGNDDEDGIVFMTGLIPGQQAVIDVYNSVGLPIPPNPAGPQAYLEGWIDFNGDGSFAEVGDQVFFNTALPPVHGTYFINVPATATPNITTYARFRYSSNPNGHGPTGLASDGEVEDYEVKIGPSYEPKPITNNLKWSQPPIEWDPQSPVPSYCGWDELSFTAKPLASEPAEWKIVADDFRCLGQMPVTSVHWWGSYKDWAELQPPETKPQAWRIAFWSNVPAGTDTEYSHPQKLLWQVDIDGARVQEEWAGVDRFSERLPDTCFQYFVELTPEEYFHQQEFLQSHDIDSIFWISITAIYRGIPNPEFVWGWKSRPAHWMDDAVTFELQQDELKPGHLVDLTTIVPIEAELCGDVQSFDMAFELDTDSDFVKWEQSFSGIRRWPHYEDEKSMAVEEIVAEPSVKYAQMPDLEETGMDVDTTVEYYQDRWRPQILADDFLCTDTGPITDITIWGSFYEDRLPGMPPGNPSAMSFTLRIYADIAADESPNSYSMPGKQLWTREFKPDEFNVHILRENLKEGYYSPCGNPPFYEFPGDTVCWQYDFHVNPAEAFTQQGNPDQQQVYWLSVEARPSGPQVEPGPSRIRFGWKSSLDHWNDDAVWASGSELPRMWHELRYPKKHRYEGESVDLAFQIATQKETVQRRIIRQVCDDWRCQGTTPVTAVTWWGSYIGYRYAACQCENASIPRIKPDYFLLSVWSDVPANTDLPYSHPGELLWQYEARDFDEVLVGYDKHPEQGGINIGTEPVFRYSVRLPQQRWFHQQEEDAIFWLSILAVFEAGKEPVYDWGWTNHKHVFQDDAVAGQWKLDGTAPTWVWEEQFDQAGESEDMSFMLFTQPDCFPSWYSTYHDWVAMGKPECWCAPPHGSGYQCDADVDGQDSGFPARYRVFIGDLNLLVENWMRRIDDAQLNPCADVDHLDSGFPGYYRVFIKDLNMLVANWRKQDSDLPGDCPRPE